MSAVKVLTLTVDTDSITTTVHGSEQECYDDLRENYAEDFEGTDDAMVEELTERQGVVFYIEEHTVEVGGARKIEILHTRDPDASCEFDVWVDGKRIEDPSIKLHIESVDPGAGHQMSDWREGTDEIRNAPEYTPEFRDAVVATRVAYEDSTYIEGN